MEMRSESERFEHGGLARDCLASYVVAGLQDEPAIFDLDPEEKFLPTEEEDGKRELPESTA